MSKSVLILCTANSARSQMGEALFREIAGDQYEVFSAGTSPSYVRPEAIAVCEELGLDMSVASSKSLDQFLDKDIDFVLTVCNNAQESCPVFPAAKQTIHKGFDDPAELKGNKEERLEEFRRIRNEMNAYLREEFLARIQKKEAT